jgi:hypothetical protein
MPPSTLPTAQTGDVPAASSLRGWRGELRGALFAFVCLFVLDFIVTDTFSMEHVTAVCTGRPASVVHTPLPAPPPFAYTSLCRFEREGDNGKTPRNAYVLTLAGRSQDTYNHMDLIRSGTEAVCSLRRTKPVFPIVVILANTPESWGPALLEAGADQVLDMSSWDTRAYYRPVYTCAAFQNRKDGHNTYYKFAAFNLTADYDRIIVFDADIIWHGNPDKLFEEYKNELFVAFSEASNAHTDSQYCGGMACRTYDGLNSHVHMLRTDSGMFAKLQRRSLAGYYRIFTNGEQDVYEAEFGPDSAVWGSNGRSIPDRTHKGSLNPPCFGGTLPTEH